MNKLACGADQEEFEVYLEDGKVGESEIAWNIMRRGYTVLPVYEIQKGQYKGPSAYTPDGGSIVAPDMLAFNGKRTAWVEAKHKSSFTWWRAGQVWETGIDLHHYYDYMKLIEISGWPVWLMFLHKKGVLAPQSPGESPTGLFGGGSHGTIKKGES